MSDPPTFGSLFAGIGGIDLGLERAGWRCAWQVENDPYCTRVLAKHWPDVPRHGDIRELDTDALGSVDLVAGGFPCQPVSVAGHRRGQLDERWLWPEFHRIIRDVGPRFVFVENVPGLLVRGMGDVLGDLAACGYDAEWDCIPAAAFGAPHLRYRVCIVADAGCRSVRGGRIAGIVPGPEGTGEGEAPQRQRFRVDAGDGGADVADAQSEPIGPGLRQSGAPGIRSGRSGHGGGTADPVADTAELGLQGSGVLRHGPSERGPLQSARNGAGGAGPGAQWWGTEPGMGRVAYGVPARVDRLRGLGNAVVPQMAEWVGHRILEVMAPPAGPTIGV